MCMSTHACSCILCTPALRMKVCTCPQHTQSDVNGNAKRSRGRKGSRIQVVQDSVIVMFRRSFAYMQCTSRRSMYSLCGMGCVM